MIELSRGRPEAARSQFEDCDALLAGLEAPGQGFFPAISIGFAVEWDEGNHPRVLFEETVVMGHRLDAKPAVAFLRFSRAWAARADGDLRAAVACAEDSAAGFRAGGWAYGEALANNLLGNLHRRAGRHAAARQHLEHSLELRTQLGDRRATGVTLGALGLLAASEGDVTDTPRQLRQALELFDRIQDGFGEAGMLLNLGVVRLRAGDLDAARRLLEQVQQLRDTPGMRRTSGWVAVMLAEVATRQGDARTAAEHLADARATFARLGEQRGLEHCEPRQPTAAP